MQFAGKPATYRRASGTGLQASGKNPEARSPKSEAWDIVVVPLENVLERITFAVNGFNMTQDSCTFLLAMPPCGEPKEGDVISFLIGETVDEYEVTGDEDDNWIDPFGMNKVGMIVHTKRLYP